MEQYQKIFHCVMQQHNSAHVAQWLMHSGAMCSGAWLTSGAGVKSSVRVSPLSTKELFQIIPTHTMNRNINPW